MGVENEKTVRVPRSTKFWDLLGLRGGQTQIDSDYLEKECHKNTKIT